MHTPILGQSYVARSLNAAAARMINLFPEIVPEGGKEAAWLQKTPGLKALGEIGDGPIYGVYSFAGNLFVVSGEALYRLDAYYVPTLIGPIAATGPVSIADNGLQMFIAANGPSYIYTAATGTLTQITDTDFPGARTVCFLDGYFVFNPPNSQTIYVTASYDGTNIDALDFASAEGSPDNLVALASDHRELWCFGVSTVEVWYNAGNPNFPLERIQGAFNELGCAASYSVAKLDNGLFWLGADARGQGIVYRTNGYTGQRISTHAVEWQIQSYGDISDAIGYTYQQDGHSFYVLTFPSANATWVYDVATNSWHERGYWDGAAYTRHRSNCFAFHDGMAIVGDYADGRVYQMTPDAYDDDYQPIRWLRSWRAIPQGQNNLKRTAHHSLQLDCEAGVGEYEPNASDVGPWVTEAADSIVTESGDAIIFDIGGYSLIPNTWTSRVMLRWSDDGGHVWSNEHWQNMGAIGQYGYRTIWRRLGMTQKLRDRVYEVSGTDSVKIAIMGAELIMSPTNG